MERDDKTHHVVHELDWTRLSDGKTGKGTGDRTQRPLEGGFAEGFQVDGARAWTGQGGTWDLAIEGVLLRWVDPVPQAGTYRLADPKERSIQMSFGRVDEDTIKVTLESGAKSFSFNVSKAGPSPSPETTAHRTGQGSAERADKSKTAEPFRDRLFHTAYREAGWTGLEPAASGVTGRRYNRLNYHPNVANCVVAVSFSLTGPVFTNLVSRLQALFSFFRIRLSSTSMRSRVGGTGFEPATIGL